MMTKKRRAELETSVSDHEYRKAMTYAVIMRARTMNSEYNLSDTLVCMVLDELVIVLATVPDDTRSSVFIGCEKSAFRYASRNLAEMRRPVVRKQNCSC